MHRPDETRCSGGHGNVDGRGRNGAGHRRAGWNRNGSGARGGNSGGRDGGVHGDRGGDTCNGSYFYVSLAAAMTPIIMVSPPGTATAMTETPTVGTVDNTEGARGYALGKIFRNRCRDFYFFIGVFAYCKLFIEINPYVISYEIVVSQVS